MYSRINLEGVEDRQVGELSEIYHPNKNLYWFVTKVVIVVAVLVLKYKQHPLNSVTITQKAAKKSLLYNK